jgi:hypothetical protein
MSPGTNRKPKPKPETEDKGLFRGYDPISVIVDVGKNIVRSAQKDSPKAPKPSAARSGKPARNSGAYPGVGAKAREAASKAQEQATAYSKYQREANKLKRKIKANSGPTDLAGRTQRALDLKRMRGIQKEADRRKNLAQDLGLRMGGGTGKMSNPAPNTPNGRGTGTRTVSDGGGGGGTAAGNAVAKATSGGSAPKSQTATKVGSVLSAARKQKKDTMGTPITAKELANFIKFYNKTHEGTLSRSDAVLMARMLKRKSPAVAKKYGLNVAQEG